MGRPGWTIRDAYRTRVRVIDNEEGGLFLSVGRPKDDDSTERVAELSRIQALRVVAALLKALLKSEARR